jgi:hypothetical protein
MLSNSSLSRDICAVEMISKALIALQDFLVRELARIDANERLLVLRQ